MERHRSRRASRFEGPARVVGSLLIALVLASCSGAVGGSQETLGEGGRGAGGDGPLHDGGFAGGGTASGCSAVGPRIWALSPEQIRHTVHAVAPAIDIDAGRLRAAFAASPGEFSTYEPALKMSEPLTSALLDQFELTAPRLVQNEAVKGCAAQAAPKNCAADVIAKLGKSLFRRPLVGDELQRHQELFGALLDQKAAAAEAFEGVVTAMLMSPNFLYRWESSADRLDAYQVASLLSYGISDGPPDAELMKAADDGALADKQAIRAQAQRLLAKPSGAPAVLSFLRELFDYDNVRAKALDEAEFPAFEPAREALAEESDAFVQAAMWDEDARLETLLTGRFGVLAGPERAIYGLSASANASGAQRVDDLGETRAGILTRGAWLAAHAHDGITDIVGRGLFVRRQLLCTEIPPPPPDVPPVPMPNGKLTGRARMEVHNSDPRCAACHAGIDPLGLAFETYDAAGQHREQEAGQVIDPSGRVELEGGQSLSFASAPDLSTQLARSPEVHSCVVTQTFRFMAGHAPADADGCIVDQLSHTFAETKGNVRELIADVLTAQAIRNRQGDAP